MDYVKSIQDKAKEFKKINNKVWYINDKTKLIFRFLVDGDKFLGALEFRKPEENYMFSEIISPEDFYENYLNEKDLELIHHKVRYYGEPKFKKPKELTGIKEFESIKFIKTKCKIYKKGDDLWIYHRDYFSSEAKIDPDDTGLPLQVLAERRSLKKSPKKFIYEDSWGSIIERNEAYLIVKNLFYKINLNPKNTELVNELCRLQEELVGIEPYELNSDMCRFWDSVICATNKYISKEDV